MADQVKPRQALADLHRLLLVGPTIATEILIDVHETRIPSARLLRGRLLPPPTNNAIAAETGLAATRHHPVVVTTAKTIPTTLHGPETSSIRAVGVETSRGATLADHAARALDDVPTAVDYHPCQRNVQEAGVLSLRPETANQFIETTSVDKIQKTGGEICYHPGSHATPRHQSPDVLHRPPAKIIAPGLKTARGTDAAVVRGPRPEGSLITHLAVTRGHGGVPARR